MAGKDKEVELGARKGENRFKCYQENMKLKRVVAIKEALRKAKALRVSFTSFSHLADFVVSEIKLGDNEEKKVSISKSTLYRTPDYRYLINNFLDSYNDAFDKASKSSQNLKDFSLMLKVKMLEAENSRLKLFIENSLSLEDGFKESHMSGGNIIGMGSDKTIVSNNGGDRGVRESGELDAAGKLCSLIEAMVYKSEYFYEVKDGMVVTSAYGEEDELVGDVDIQEPFREWFLSRYHSDH
ncbi:hypothetical protein [Halomonas rhizosphaerae]|uniref:MADS-box domain-containing protein n=1 Tax=Halomonas rhizosphaerae TaxID=3043296 RepID=A0ABT6UU68_9GAMM|nr:hypothetical protein [Halomonas rhizosphaerae]MDI5889500.1 hypothetical protein [Halomonas rhizosphaerae]